MARRARSVVVSQTTTAGGVVQTIQTETPPGMKLTPMTQRLLPTFQKIDKKEYFSEEEFDRICLLVAGDSKRAVQRLLLGLYQRALLKHDDAEVKRTRLMISLHEAGRLDENLENL